MASLKHHLQKKCNVLLTQQQNNNKTNKNNAPVMTFHQRGRCVVVDFDGFSRDTALIFCSFFLTFSRQSVTKSLQ
jgi:hypothetical protein